MTEVDNSLPVSQDMAPKLHSFVQRVVSDYPVFEKTLLSYLEHLDHQGERYYRDAEKIVDLAFRLMESGGGSEEDALECYAEFCMEYLREQQSFLATGQYSGTAKGFEAAREEVYANATYMTQYMIGHLLSCAVFPHHYAQYAFFLRDFVPSVAPDAVCCELGTGHGLWLTTLLAGAPGRRAVGYDISETCLALTRRTMALCGVSEDRCQIKLGNVLEQEYPENAYGAMIASGLLEHLEDPRSLLSRACPALVPDSGRMFVMVPTNLAHPDHLTLFETVGEIRTLYTGSGLEIVSEVSAPTKDIPEEACEREKVPIVHLAILKRPAL